jgi:hypothetical protein
LRMRIRCMRADRPRRLKVRGSLARRVEQGSHVVRDAGKAGVGIEDADRGLVRVSVRVVGMSVQAEASMAVAKEIGAGGSRCSRRTCLRSPIC